MMMVQRNVHGQGFQKQTKAVFQCFIFAEKMTTLYRRQERFGQDIQRRIQGKGHALFRMVETLNKNTWGVLCRAVLPKQARG